MNKRKIISYGLLGFILLLVGAFSMLNYYSTTKYVVDSVERETNELLTNFTAETNRFSLERVAELELMAEHLPYIIDDNTEVLNFLHKQIENRPYFTGLGFISPDGNILAADGSQFQAKQIDSFERALAGHTVFSDIFTLHQDPTQRVTAISLPVSLDGDVIGVISGVVNMGNLIGNLIEESSLPGTVFY